MVLIRYGAGISNLEREAWGARATRVRSPDFRVSAIRIFARIIKSPDVIRGIVLVVVAIFAMATATYFYSNRNRGRLPAGTTIDRIVVEKSHRKLSVSYRGKKLKTYRVALGRNPVGPKQEEGDMKTPEGIYQIDSRKIDSDYHLALHISYPSDEDRARAAERGVSAGSDIEIHGLPNGRGAIGAAHRLSDWTAGCIALTDEEIEELSRVTPEGTIVEIQP
jgi:murein L,D-transpeptidase YafK